MKLVAPLYVLRHGETAWNTERRMQGLKDLPLTERGRRTDSREPASEDGHPGRLIEHDPRPSDVDRLGLLAIATKPSLDHGL